MTAREYLEGIRELNEQIDAHVEELNRMRAQAEAIRSPGFEEHFGGSRNGDAPFAPAVEAAIEMETRISAEIARLASLKIDASKRIGRLKKPKERLVLQYRYLNGLSWKDIMVKMDRTESSVHTIHRNALEHFTPPKE